MTDRPALICRRDVPGGPDAVTTIWSVRQSDGFLLECGAGPEGEKRAYALLELHMVRSNNESWRNLVARLVASVGGLITVWPSTSAPLGYSETHDPLTGTRTFKTEPRRE